MSSVDVTKPLSEVSIDESSDYAHALATVLGEAAGTEPGEVESLYGEVDVEALEAFLAGTDASVNAAVQLSLRGYTVIVTKDVVRLYDQ